MDNTDFKIKGCRGCPFFVDERDLHKCYHPEITLVSFIDTPRYGEDVYEDVYKNKQLSPSWCPLNNESITIIKSL